MFDIRDKKLNEAKRFLKNRGYKIINESIDDDEFNNLIQLLDKNNIYYTDDRDESGCINIYGNDADYEIVHNTNPRYRKGVGFYVEISTDDDSYEKFFDTAEEVIKFIK